MTNSKNIFYAVALGAIAIIAIVATSSLYSSTRKLEQLSLKLSQTSQQVASDTADVYTADSQAMEEYDKLQEHMMQAGIHKNLSPNTELTNVAALSNDSAKCCTLSIYAAGFNRYNPTRGGTFYNSQFPAYEVLIKGVTYARFETTAYRFDAGYATANGYLERATVKVPAGTTADMVQVKFVNDVFVNTNPKFSTDLYVDRIELSDALGNKNTYYTKNQSTKSMGSWNYGTKIPLTTSPGYYATPWLLVTGGYFQFSTAPGGATIDQKFLGPTPAP